MDCLAPRSVGQALEVLRAFPAKTSSAAAAQGGRRLGLRPALAARGHRGNYTPRCRRLPARPRIPLYFPLSSLPLLRGAAVSILASAPGKCGGRGQLPLGTPPGFLHAARPPGCRGELSATGNASHARHSPGSGCRGPEGATGPFCKRCKTCSRVLPRNPAPSQCSHPSTSNPRRDSVSQVSLASRPCAFQLILCSTPRPLA